MSDYFAWRRPRSVLPLENFDIPELHHRAALVPVKIEALTEPRTAGQSYRPSPERIRDAIRDGMFDATMLGYLSELFQSFTPYDVRLFQVYGGITRYELARAMIAAGITRPVLCEWMNGHVPGYESTLDHHCTWDMGWVAV